MEILPITEEHWQEAKEIYCECFNKPNIPTTIPLSGTLIGLFQEFELIGLVQIDYINDIFTNTKIAYLNNFCMKKKYQNQGYGEYLLKTCIEKLKKENINTIQLTCNKNRSHAHKLYQKYEFTPIDTVFLKKNI